MMKFRVKRLNNNYYAQVMHKNFLGNYWFCKWYRIGKHPGESYGLYPEDDHSHGVPSRSDAQKIYKPYLDWYHAQSGPVRYYYSDA